MAGCWSGHRPSPQCVGLLLDWPRSGYYHAGGCGWRPQAGRASCLPVQARTDSTTAGAPALPTMRARSGSPRSAHVTNVPRPRIGDGESGRAALLAATKTRPIAAFSQDGSGPAGVRDVLLRLCSAAAPRPCPLRSSASLRRPARSPSPARRLWARETRARVGPGAKHGAAPRGHVTEAATARCGGLRSPHGAWRSPYPLVAP